MLALLLVGALPAGELTLLLELGGQPAGMVTLSRSGTDYRYVSRHLFALQDAPTERVREGRYAVDARGRTARGAIPAGLWLWTRPAPGCVQGLEELDDVVGPQCARPGARGEVVGTLRGVSFTAHYDPQGQLQLLELPGARLRRVHSGTSVRASPALLERFAKGIALPPGDGPLAWVGDRADLRASTPRAPLSRWSAQEARALAREVDASFTDKRQGPADFDPSRVDDARGGCLAHARRFVARAAAGGRRAAVVHGLVAHQGALRPHAWVQVGLAEGGTLELDPALGVPVEGHTHLALGEDAPGAGSAQLGAAWWQVLTGKRQVTRGCAADQRRHEVGPQRTGAASRARCGAASPAPR